MQTAHIRESLVPFFPIGIKGMMRNRTDDENYLKIGQFVRARRKANGLTQRRLAELAGVGERLVVELEQAKPNLRLSSVNAVLAVFGKALGVVDAERMVEP